MKILYHIGHHGALLLCLLHKNIYHHNDDAVFLYDTSVNPKNGETYSFVERMKKNLRNFGTVITYSHSSIMGKTSVELALQELQELYSEIFSPPKMNISKFNLIYMTFDEWNPFACYMNAFHPEIELNTILLSSRYGDYRGDESKDGAIKWQEERDIPVSKIHNKYKAYVWTDNIKKVYRTFESKNNYYNEMPLIDMDSMINQLPSDALSELLDLYELNTISIKSDSFYQLFVVAGWFRERIEKQGINFFAFYQQLLDYFSDCKKVLLKQHPRHIICDKEIKECFPAVCATIPSYIPSQLLCKYDELKVRSILNFGSGGTTGFENKVMHYYFDKFWYIAPKVEAFFWLNKLYTCFELAQFLNFKHIRYYGLAVETMNNIKEYWYQYNFNSFKWMNFYKEKETFASLPLGTVILLGKVDWHKDQDADEIKTSFLEAADSNRDDLLYVIFDTANVDLERIPEKYKNIIYMIEIMKRKNRDNIKTQLKRERIFIISKNDILIKRLEHFKTFRNLFNTGISK